MPIICGIETLSPDWRLRPEVLIICASSSISITTVRMSPRVAARLSLIRDEVEIAIQVNGKIKGRIMVPASLTREQGDTLREHEAVKAAVGDKQIVKFIFVPGRLLNIVVK